MKFAVQEGLLPGRTLAEKVDHAGDYGFDGVELGGHGLAGRLEEVTKVFENHSVRVSTICAGFEGCPLDVDKGERDRAQNDVVRLLEMAGHLGAVGLIFVPIFGGPRIPDLSPLKTARELELDLLVEWLDPVSEAAQRANTLLLVEPLNRYETHLLRRLADAGRVVRRAGGKGLAIMADLFHMSIEEDDIPKAIEAEGRRIRHVHLADSQRLQPGTGHTDFRGAFRALHRAGFGDYMALECGIRGRPSRALPECVNFLKKHARS